MKLDIENQIEVRYPKNCYAFSTNDILFSAVTKEDVEDVWVSKFDPHSCREVLTSRTVFMTRDTGTSHGKVFNFVNTKKFPAKDIEVAILIQMSDERIDKRLLTNLHKISEYEEALGVEESILRSVKDRRGVYVLTISKKWLSSPLTISILSLLIRYASKMPVRCRKSISDYYIGKSIANKTLINQMYDSFLHVDIKGVLRNIDFILGEDPISGINDKLMKSYYSKSDQVCGQNAILPINLVIDPESILSKSVYNMSASSAGYCGGIYTFSNTINKLIKSPLKDFTDILNRSDSDILEAVAYQRHAIPSRVGSTLSGMYGVLWVINYLKLLRKELDDENTK